MQQNCYSYTLTLCADIYWRRVGKRVEKEYKHWKK